MFRSMIYALVTLLALPASAQEVLRFGNDAYLVGDNVTVMGEAVDDAFIAGNTVVISVPIAGSAHAAARSVSVSGPIGQNLYAMGMNVNIASMVGGDSHLLGDTVLVNGDVAGDLRVGSQRVEINGSIGDSALIGAESILLTDVIAGDAHFSTKVLAFGENARVDGTLHIYAKNPDAFEVPATVAPADRIVRHSNKEFDPDAAGLGDDPLDRATGGWSTWLRGMVVTVLVLAAIATALAAIAPSFVQALRLRTLETPIRAFWMGFLTLSAAAGSMLILALTGYGILLAPISIAVALLLGLAGYVIGTYILGVGVLGLANRPLPATLGERAIAALAGALTITVLALIPVIGWVAVLIVATTGAGALVVRWFAPGFYTELR